MAGRAKDATRSFQSERGTIYSGFPVAVLVNEGSASGCEIIAGALQDWKIAAVFGNRSWGKGSVQTILPLKGGGALRLTTAEYRTPSGRQINGVGVEPDFLEPAAPDTLLDPARRQAYDATLEPAAASRASAKPVTLLRREIEDGLILGFSSLAFVGIAYIFAIFGRW